MKYSFATFFSVLIAAVIFTAPSNLFLVLNENVGYVNGMRIDYLMPKIYLSDIFIMLLLTIGFSQIEVRQKLILLLKKHIYPLIILLIIFISSLIFAKLPIASIVSMIKIIEMGLLLFILVSIKHQLKAALVLNALYLSIAIQTLFAWSQFLIQKSVTAYQLFGETQFSQTTIGIARATLLGQEKILSYGTTAHPNILAGVIVLCTLLILHLQSSKSLLKNILIIGNAALILFITQSFSALISLCIGIPIWYFWREIQTSQQLKKYFCLIGVLLFATTPLVILIATQLFSHDFSLFRRNELDISALKMFNEHPITGAGLGNFTAVLESYLSNKELVRFLQPAHHVGVLWLAETGVLGLVLLLQLLSTYKHTLLKMSPLLLPLIPLLSLDHYLVTVQTGMIVAVLYSGLLHSKKYSLQLE